MRRPPPRLGPLRQLSSESDKFTETSSLRHEKVKDGDLLSASMERHGTPPGSVHLHQTIETGIPGNQNIPRSSVRLIDMETNSVAERDGDSQLGTTERVTDSEACDSPKSDRHGAAWKGMEPQTAILVPGSDPPNRESVQSPGVGVILRENAAPKPPLLRLTSQTSSIRKSIYARDLPSHTIRGSVHIQMPIHFLWYGLLLGVANIHWIDTLRAWTLLFYFFASFCVVQIRRLIVQINPVSTIPLYLSYVPYAIFHLLAREAHMIFGVLWFLSSIIMNMQNGSAKLRHHVIGSMITFIVVYVSCTLIQYGLFTPATGEMYYMLSPLRVRENKGHTEAEWEEAGILAQEVTFLISIVLLGGALCMLHRFMKIYALSLVDRNVRVHDLYLANVELRRQLKGISLDATKLDLDSPITKVIQSIRNIQYMRETDSGVAENLDFVVRILSSNQLFVPEIKKGDHMDSEVLMWLKTMMMTRNGSAERNLDIDAADIHLNNANLMQSITLTVPAQISSNDAELYSYLDEHMLKWDFDVFEFAKMTNGRPLFHIGYKIFANEGFAAQYQIEDATIRKFLKKMENGYLPNAYHNSLHAADVLQTVYFFLVNFQLKDFMTIDDVFSTVFAAIVHDVDHPGVNSNFLINARSPLAILYNDTSVLENHHCSKAFEYVLSDPMCNVFANIRADKFKALRGNIISMVLATDMTRHFEYITRFKNKIAGAGFDFADQKDRQLLMDFAIKCADVSNPTKSLPLYKKWVDVIFAEFFKQGDQEKVLNIPVTMFMDRNVTSIPKSQIGFIDFVIMPLYEVWHTYNDGESCLPMQNLKDNREYWKLQHDEEISKQSTAAPNVESTANASSSQAIPPP